MAFRKGATLLGCFQHDKLGDKIKGSKLYLVSHYRATLLGCFQHDKLGDKIKGSKLYAICHAGKVTTIEQL
ncbi:MAG: hypothetical protein I4O51_08020 [Flavobacterium micromati]|nr:hypothetical protein [Flavobacterium micromati]